jgi:hypothetical protein
LPEEAAPSEALRTLARVVRRLRPLSEVECYARCYGSANGEVRLLPTAPRRVVQLRLSGEQVRRLFEERLEAREAEAA